MKVAVLMSTYNGEKYIEEQIESIISQKGDFELELFVRDDGSTDRTIEILKKYERLGKLHYYKGNNIGPALSFLELLRNYKEYDFYAFSDQDDYWKQGKVKEAVEKMEESRKPILYFSNAEVVNCKLEYLGKKVYKKNPIISIETLSCAGGILGCTVLINNALAKMIQMYKCPENVIMHDYYIAEVCLSLGGKIIYDCNSYIKYRQHSDNVVGVTNGKISAIYDRIKKIISKNKIGIDDQAKEILKIYGKNIEGKEKKWLEQVAMYKKTTINRIKLSLSRKVKIGSLNSNVTIRLSILLGNR